MKKLICRSQWLLALLLIGSSCDKDEQTIAPEANKCYEGNIVAVNCPSFVMVQVIRDKIGEEWTIDSPLLGAKGTFDNAITINNQPEGMDLKKGQKIYFTIDIEASKNAGQCVKFAPCTQERDWPFPNKQFCVKNLSTQKCFED